MTIYVTESTAIFVSSINHSLYLIKANITLFIWIVQRFWFTYSYSNPIKCWAWVNFHQGMGEILWIYLKMLFFQSRKISCSDIKDIFSVETVHVLMVRTWDIRKLPELRQTVFYLSQLCFLCIVINIHCTVLIYSCYYGLRFARKRAYAVVRVCI